MNGTVVTTMCVSTTMCVRCLSDYFLFAKARFINKCIHVFLPENREALNDIFMLY